MPCDKLADSGVCNNEQDEGNMTTGVAESSAGEIDPDQSK